MKYINKCRRLPNLLYTVNDSSNQNSAYFKKNHMLMQKTVTILRKQCPNNASRSSLSRKLYNWFQLVSFTIVFTFALRRLRRRRRRRRKIEGGGRDRKAEQKEDTELCTSQAFVDCSTIYTMLLLLNINILLGRGLCTFSNKTKRGHFNDRGSKVLFGIDDDESCQPPLP